MAEYRVFAPEELVIPGEKVWVKVLKIDRKRRTIDLSMAQAVVPDPPDEAPAEPAAETVPLCPAPATLAPRLRCPSPWHPSDHPWHHWAPTLRGTARSHPALQ